MTITSQKRSSLLAQVRRVMALYKRPGAKRKAAETLLRDVTAQLMPYLNNQVPSRQMLPQVNIMRVMRESGADATETQQVAGDASCNGAADTLAARDAEQRAATRGAGGVSLLASPGKANSFSTSGTKTQCSESDYTIVPIQPAVTLAGVLAKYAKPPVGVVEIGHEKAPEPEEARGAEVAAEWPSECEVLVTGVCPNPRLMAGEIWAGGRKTGRKVSLWKTWKGERAGVVVRARLERGSGREALYAVVYPEKTVVVPAAAGA